MKSKLKIHKRPYSTLFITLFCQLLHHHHHQRDYTQQTKLNKDNKKTQQLGKVSLLLFNIETHEPSQTSILNKYVILWKLTNRIKLEQKNMNRSQPPNIIAAQQKLLEGISRQVSSHSFVFTELR